MKRYLLAIPLFLLLASLTHAQTTVVNGAGLMPSGSALPTVCNPANVGDPDSQVLFYHTTSSGGAIGLYQCTAANTWSAVGGGGGVTSLSGDGTIITNSASTGAITLTIAGTSGGIPCFNSASTWQSSAAITNNDIIDGGGAGACAKDSGILSTNVVQLVLGSTQTLQCTQNGTCLIVKQSAGGGSPFTVQTSGGAAILATSIGGTFAVTAGSGFGFSGAFGNAGNSHIIMSLTAPSVAAAGCGGSGASITSNNGTASFKVGVGTSNSGTCTITMPAANTDWVCSANDITTKSTTVSQTTSKPGGAPTTQITLQNYTDVTGTGAWTDSDVIQVSCMAE